MLQRRGSKGPINQLLLQTRFRSCDSLEGHAIRHREDGIPCEQVCSPIIEISISTPQLEHLMAGNMLNALGAKAMMATDPLRSSYSNCGARGLGHAFLQPTDPIPKVPSLVLRTSGSELCNDTSKYQRSRSSCKAQIAQVTIRVGAKSGSSSISEQGQSKSPFRRLAPVEMKSRSM